MGCIYSDLLTQYYFNIKKEQIKKLICSFLLNIKFVSEWVAYLNL